MANIEPSKSINIDKELGTLDIYKYSPNAIVQVTLNRLQDMLDGKVVLLEPSTPFTYLLETTCMNTAFAVQEFAMLTRKLYPRLANNDEDLYLHMSDYDYLGRFSEPSSAKVIFNIMFNDFKTKANYDPVLREYVFKLPRHLKVLIGKYVYLLTSAVVIRLASNDVVDVRFENQDFNNIFPVKTNHINYFIKNVGQTESYISFELELPEVDIEVNDLPVDLTSVFSGELTYKLDRKYYYFRAFYYQDEQYKEMLVTHTNEVYDISVPTCIIKVLPTENKVKYSVPSVYLNSRQVTGNIRVLLYTTTGYNSVNFSDFQIGDFSVEYGDVFPTLELDKYTTALQSITKIVYIQENVNSGKDGLSFEELKSAVIDNSIGDRKLPITAKQLTFSTGQNNFKIIKDVDVVTNRIYKLETQLPPPKTRYPVTKYNLDILEYATTIENLRSGNGVKMYTQDITVINQGTIFKLDSGILSLLTPSQAASLTGLTGSGLITETNRVNYLSVYYHYVIDTSENKTELRAYDLNKPKIKSSSFKSFNETARVSVNTVTNNLYKSPQGYTLDVLANLKKFSETIGQNQVKPVLVYTDIAGSKFYLSSLFTTMIGEQPVYRFNIVTDYFIDKDNKLQVTNFLDNNGMLASIFIDLEANIDVIYTTDVIAPAFVSSSIDNYIKDSYLQGSCAVVTLEEMRVVFGSHLEHLFCGVHSSTGTYDYEVYSSDEVARYTKTVYNANNEIVHQVGQVVLNELGVPVITHRAGDVKLNPQGLPSPVSTLKILRYLNLLFIDYKVTLCGDAIYKDYNNQIRAHITKSCLDDALEVQKQLLDNSQAFVVIPKTVGYVKINTQNKQMTIPSAQRFSVDVFVTFDVFNNTLIRDNITYSVVQTMDEYLSANNVLKKTEVLNTLYTTLKDFIVSVSFDYFTQLNAEYMQIVDDNARLSVAKLLISSANGYELKENIDVNFKLVD